MSHFTRMAKISQRRKNLYFTGRSSLPEAELGRRVAKRLPRLPRFPNRIAQNRSSGIEPLGVRSRRLLMVIAQEPTHRGMTSIAARLGSAHTTGNGDRASAPRVAVYLRVSTGRQAEHDLSIPDQKAQASAWVAQRGWTIAAEYVEGGSTATDDKRPEFQKMIERA